MLLKGKKSSFTELNVPFTESVWENLLSFWKLGINNLASTGMAHLFNALILLLFVAIIALFSNTGEKKDNEVFHNVLQVYRTDSVSTDGSRYPTDLQQVLKNK
ncbi:hypothetical protein [Sphingobacterium sp. DR205]|uniref:hypothetical protein n=1 Tax=Sphingobacterium sp. DR205 TaxID=2713573 RepID=UPI0013E509C3|nr:hypothetical protein [Sphingobacterium sp. DR205]QIH35668.1 hypothetical protein G6053_23580 [Sphingobacterium sp. DR205]